MCGHKSDSCFSTYVLISQTQTHPKHNTRAPKRSRCRQLPISTSNAALSRQLHAKFKVQPSLNPQTETRCTWQFAAKSQQQPFPFNCPTASCAAPKAETAPPPSILMIASYPCISSHTHAASRNTSNHLQGAVTTACRGKCSCCCKYLVTGGMLFLGVDMLA